MNITANVNFFIKLLLKINIFNIQLGRRADKTKFKDFYPWRSIAINSEASFK